MYLFQRLVLASFCIWALDAAGEDQKYRDDTKEGRPLWVLANGNLVPVPVRRLVTYDLKAGSQDEKELILQGDVLKEIQKAASKANIGEEPIYPISIMGYNSACNKAVVLNAAGTASVESLEHDPDETLVDFGLQCSAEDGPYGIYVSDPIKRYGKWFIMITVNFEHEKSNGVTRIRSLALQLSAGVVFVSPGPFKFDSNLKIDDALVMTTSEDVDQDEGFTRIKCVGLRYAKGREIRFESKPFAPEFFVTASGGDQKEQMKFLKKVYDPIAFDVYRESTELHEELQRDPRGYYEQNKDSDQTEKQNAIRSYSAFVNMVGTLMQGVGSEGQWDRTLTISSFSGLWTHSVAMINSRDIDTKTKWEQIGHKTCSGVIEGMFKNDFGTTFRREYKKRTVDGVEVEGPDMDKFINDTGDDGKLKLARQLPMVWNTIKVECEAAFDSILNEKRIEEKDKRKTEAIQNRDRTIEARDRTIADRDRRIKELEDIEAAGGQTLKTLKDILNFISEYWWHILLGLIGLFIFGKVLKCTRCLTKCFCFKSKSSGGLEKWERALERKERRLDRIEEKVSREAMVDGIPVDVEKKTGTVVLEIADTAQ